MRWQEDDESRTQEDERDEDYAVQEVQVVKEKEENRHEIRREKILGDDQDEEQEEREKTMEKAWEERIVEAKIKEDLSKLRQSDVEMLEMRHRQRTESALGRREFAVDLGRRTFIKVNRKYLLPDALDPYGLPWEWDEVGH